MVSALEKFHSNTTPFCNLRGGGIFVGDDLIIKFYSPDMIEV